MPTIIGFVPTQSSNLNISLPIGFKDNGSQINTGSVDWANECQLIFLDDDLDALTYVKGSGPVLVVQHNGNAENWDQQIQQLADWNWEPSRIDKYSRINTFRFWQEVIAILSEQDKNKRADIITSMLNRYRDVDSIDKLDAASAWFILSTVETNTTNQLEYKRRIGKILKTLPDSPEKIILNLNLKNSNIGDFITLANDMARKLMVY